MSASTVMGFESFEDFTQEVERRATALAESIATNHKQRISLRSRSYIAGPLRVHSVEFRTEYSPGKFVLDHTFTSVFHEREGRFVSARVMKSKVSLNKAQPKTPMGLADVKFESDTSPTLRGLGKKFTYIVGNITWKDRP